MLSNKLTFVPFFCTAFLFHPDERTVDTNLIGRGVGGSHHRLRVVVVLEHDGLGIGYRCHWYIRDESASAC